MGRIGGAYGGHMVKTGPRIGIDHKIRWADLDLIYHWWLEGRRIAPEDIISHWQHVQGLAARKKAATIMTRLWNQPFWQEPVNDNVLRPTLAANRLLGYWGLWLSAYPFFLDTATIIGRLLALSDCFTTRQVYHQMSVIYGDTERVRVGVKMILGSLTEWKVLKRVKVGQYVFNLSPVEVKGNEQLAFVMYVTLHAVAQDRIAMDVIDHLPWWFPFHIELSRSAFQGAGLVVEPSGGDYFTVGRLF